PLPPRGADPPLRPALHRAADAPPQRRGAAAAPLPPRAARPPRHPRRAAGRRLCAARHERLGQDHPGDHPLAAPLVPARGVPVVGRRRGAR
ncbi:hypothetical protein BN1708_020096, partial [Verticillium longisporum]